ncbi:hypothetical protein HYV88_06500 [Candidatus Woesearchaeota archaeon]|nr:hypothetical protein [Candidatus Woesearchaeota archaeon]
MNKKLILIGLFIISVFAYANFALAVCGDGVIDTGEECDGINLGNPASTCVSQGYALGILGCYPSTDTQFGCKFDVTGCVGASSNFVSVQEGNLNAENLTVNNYVKIGNINPEIPILLSAGDTLTRIQSQKNTVLSIEGGESSGILLGGKGGVVSFLSDTGDFGWTFGVVPGLVGNNNLVIIDKLSSIPLVIEEDTGNVGVGTTTPQGKLDVGDVANPTAGVCPVGYVHNDIDQDTIIDNGECWRGIFIKNGKINLTGDLEIGGTINGASGLGGVWTKSGTTDNIYYNNGKVGIGTNIPDKKLTVFGDAYIGPSDEDTYPATAEWVSLSAGDIDTCPPYSAQTSTPGNTANAYTCLTADSFTCTDIKDNNKKGTVTCRARNGLDIAPDGTITVGGIPFGAGGGVWQQATTSGNIYYNGKVGIGTNNPLEKLDVNGNVRVSGSGQATSIQIGFDVPVIETTVSTGGSWSVAGTVCHVVTAKYSSSESSASNEKCNTVTTNSKITITWSDIEHAIGYNIYRRNGNQFFKIGNIAENLNSFDDTGTGLGELIGAPIISPPGGLATAGGLVVGGDLEVKGNLIGTLVSAGVNGGSISVTTTNDAQDKVSVLTMFNRDVNGDGALDPVVGTTPGDQGWTINAYGPLYSLASARNDLIFYKYDGNQASPWVQTLTLDSSGMVGIGTVSPSSKLQIGSPTDINYDYLQIDSGTTGPTATDCDSDNEAGRMYVVRDVGGDPNVDILRVCSGASGWKSATLL